MRVFRTIMLAGVCCFALAANTMAAVDSACKPTKYLLVFANGVLVSPTGMRVSKRRLAELVRPQLTPTQRELFRSDLAENPTNGALLDLLEAVNQSLLSDITRFWRILAGLAPMPEFFSEAITQQLASIGRNGLVTNNILQSHVAKYKTAILEGNVVVVTPHSQGNFFANGSYDFLNTDERQRLAIVSVANPDTFVAGDGPYTTRIGDLVIDAIILLKRRLGLPIPLLPNTAGLPSLNDLTGHFFVESYLKRGGSARTKLISNIVQEFNSLTPLPAPAGQGAIVATLTWGAQPDVDLHAFEPSGAHVFYAQKVGVAGTLDVDDVTSFGPEHYVVPCNTLQPGSYRIGVNYYRGTAPETAQVDIVAGDKNRVFDKLLTTAIGSAGNSSPIPIATVTVAGTAESGYSFEILNPSPSLQDHALAIVDNRPISISSLRDAIVAGKIEPTTVIKPEAIINGNNKNNVITGTAQGDTISGRGGNDTLHGAAGNDLLKGDAGSDLLLGEGDDDIIIGGDGDDRLIGSAGYDVYYGQTGANVYGWNLTGTTTKSRDLIVAMSALDKVALGPNRAAIFTFLDSNRDGVLTGADEFVIDYGAGLQLDLSSYFGVTSALDIEGAHRLSLANFVI